MVRPPHWLTDKGVDEIVSSEYDEVRKEFMNILTAEEERYRQATSRRNNLPLLSEVLNSTWAAGTFWYTLALSSPSGLFGIFKHHIRPLFCTEYLEEFNLVMPFLWEKNVGHIASCKLSDKEEYDRQLQIEFETVLE
jgi:hypothetical protein